MIRVQVRPNEPLEAALRRFKRQCNYAGIFRLAKKYAYHEKRSDKRRRVRSSSVKPRKAGEDFDPLTADTTPQKPEGATENTATVTPNTAANESTTPTSTETPTSAASE